MVEKLQPNEIEGKGRPVVVIVNEKEFANRWERPFEGGPYEVITVVPRDYVDLEQKLFCVVDEETRSRIALVFCHRYWGNSDCSFVIQGFIDFLRETNEEAIIIEAGNAIEFKKRYSGVNASVEAWELADFLEKFPAGSTDLVDALRKHIFFDKDYSFAMNIAEETDEWGRKPKSFFGKPPEERTRIFDNYLEKFFSSPMHERVLEKIGCKEDDFREAFWELPEMKRVDLLHLVFKELNLLYATGNMHDLDLQRIQGILNPEEAPA